MKAPKEILQNFIGIAPLPGPLKILKPLKKLQDGGRVNYKSGSYLFEGAKKLGKKYRGSTLESLLENPRIIGTELGYEGIAQILRILGLRDGGFIGKKSGPPPISGPTPHGDEGLPAAFKNVRNR